MNKNTPPMNPIETREIPKTLRDIENQQARLDAPMAETATEPTAVQGAAASSFPVAAEEAESAVPDAVKTDASRRRARGKLGSARARGFEWVRASELLSRGTGRMAWRGIRFHQTAGTRTRRGLASGMRAVSERVRQLPPASAFGRRSTQSMAASRSGVGMR